MKSKREKSAREAPRRIYGPVILPAAILLAAFVLRVVSLTTFDTLFDEQITSDVVTGIWHGELSNNWKDTVSAKNYHADQYNFSSYLYADALLAGTAAQLDSLVGNGKPDFVFWSRLFSALTGTLAVYLFYLLARRWFPPNTALAAMALMAVMPLLVQDSHYARPEAFVLALTGAAYLFLLRFDSRPGRLACLGYASFCFGILIACKVSLLPMTAIPLLFLASQPDGRLWLRGCGICAACTLLGIFAGVPDAFFHPAAYWHGVEFLRHQYAEGRPPHAAAGGTSVTLTLLYFWQTTGLLLLFALAGAFVLARKRQFLLLAAIGGPVAFYFAYFSVQRAFFERNLSHVAPLIAILAAVALLGICEAVPLPARPVALAALLAITIAPALWVSGKLVFIAMHASQEQRALSYETSLVPTFGKVGDTMPVFTEAQFTYAMQLPAILEQDALLRVPDYHDAFTKKHLEELERRTKWREVGYFPSLFEGMDVNTLIAYHSVSFHYLFVRAAPPIP